MLGTILKALPTLLKILGEGFKLFFVWNAGKNSVKKKIAEKAVKDSTEVCKAREDIKSDDDNTVAKRLRDSLK